MLTVVIAGFFVFAALGLPLAFALGLGSLGGVLVAGFDPIMIPGKMIHAVDSFPLMAIPLFMIAGQLMIRGGIMDPLIEFANALVGRVQGGLAHVTIVAAMGLSSVSGVAVADATALGGSLGPHLAKVYSRQFAASIVASASCLGPIIPPSGAMIVYAVVTSNVSVASLFLAGIVPGIIMGLGMMVLCSVIARRRGFPVSGEPFSARRAATAFRKAALIFGMPIVVIGGIMAGAFTATEGAAIAVVYALLIGFFVTRKLRFSDIPPALLAAGIITSVVGALIAFSSTVTYLLTLERVGTMVADAILAFTSDARVFLVIVMAILVVFGMFMEGNTVIIMLAPILAPVAASLGIDPVFFALLFVINIVLGSITPPVGVLLFVTSSIWRIGILPISREIVPFAILLYAILFSFILFPDVPMFLPRLIGP